MIKTLLFTTFTLLVLHVKATNYFVSNSGNNTNSGTDASHSWLTIDHLNTTTLKPGDTVFFKAGDTFRGTIIVKQTGTSLKRIVFTSYGTGNKPIISGADIVTAWEKTGNYFEATITKAPTSFFSNNNERIIARYPNEHNYLSFDTAQQSYLKDVSLKYIPDSVKVGTICIHNFQWCWEKSEVASYTSDKITFTTPTTAKEVPKYNYAYFLYNNITHFDTINEWIYQASSNKILYRAEIPSDTTNCEASVYPNGIELLNGISYISIYNLSFEKQTNAGVLIAFKSNTNIKIYDCYFARQFKHGVHDKGKSNEIYTNYFREVDGIAVYVSDTGGYSTIHHNTFRDIGHFRNYGIATQINLTAINCAGSTTNCNVHHNNIDSTGYCGISVDGPYHLVERNIISNAMLLNNDGAAIKSYGGNSKYITIRNNFITKSDGNTEGTIKPDFITPAIYFDFNVNNCTVQENTIYDRTSKGIFLNSGTHHNTIKGNVVFSSNYCIHYNGTPAQITPMKGMIVKNNSFFAKSASAYIVLMIDNTTGFQHGEIDSNYYVQPYNMNQYASVASTKYSFSGWQTLTKYDSASKSSFVNWVAPIGYDTLFMNQTDEVMTINLGTTKYLDLGNNEVCGNITLQPYTSKILINTKTNCVGTTINEKTMQSNLVVFPNPTSNEITITSSDESSMVKYTIVNQLGQIMDSGITQNGNSTISISKLPSGIYFIHTIGNENKITKLIKK